MAWLAAALLVACGHTDPTNAGARPRTARLEQDGAAPQPQGPEPRQPALLAIADLASLDLSGRFGAYLARDAAWVPGLPLAVNRDFDFALAMSLESIGPAVAVGRRRNENLALAQRLAALAPIDRAQWLAAFCAAAPPGVCAGAAGQQVRVYGLLFGSDEARLQVALELVENGTTRAIYGTVSEPLALEAWSSPGTLAQAWANAVPDLAAAAATTGNASDVPGLCKLTAGAKLEGHVVATGEHHVLLQLDPPLALRLACPKSCFEPSAPSPALHSVSVEPPR